MLRHLSLAAASAAVKNAVILLVYKSGSSGSKVTQPPMAVTVTGSSSLALTIVDECSQETGKFLSFWTAVQSAMPIFRFFRLLPVLAGFLATLLAEIGIKGKDHQPQSISSPNGNEDPTQTIFNSSIMIAAVDALMSGENE